MVLCGDYSRVRQERYVTIFCLIGKKGKLDLEPKKTKEKRPRAPMGNRLVWHFFIFSGKKKKKKILCGNNGPMWHINL